MNIYLLSQNESRGYDTFDSMVVIAASEAGARRMSPNNSYEWSESHGMWLFNYNPEAWGANMPDRRERRDDWANDISKIKV